MWLNLWSGDKLLGHMAYCLLVLSLLVFVYWTEMLFRLYRYLYVTFEFAPKM